MKAQFQGSADRTHFSAAVCIDASGKHYPTHYCTMGEIDIMLPPGSGTDLEMLQGIAFDGT